jgi:hypothetical protein
MARLGNNITAARNVRLEQMEYLMANMHEPDFGACVSDTGKFNKAGITWRILNTRVNSSKNHPGGSYFTQDNIGWLMAHIQQYLPEDLRKPKRQKGRSKCEWATPLWNYDSVRTKENHPVSAETQECVDRFLIWLNNMKGMIEDSLCSEYYGVGRPQCIEILKRRFACNWGDQSKQTSVSVSNNQETKDTKLEIVISEAEQV